MEGAQTEESRCAALRVNAAAVQAPRVPQRKRQRPSLVMRSNYTYNSIPLRATAAASAKRIMIFDPDNIPEPAPPLLADILRKYALPRARDLQARDLQLHVFPSEHETRGLRLQMQPALHRDKQFGQIFFLCGADAQHVPFAMARRYGGDSSHKDLYAHIQDDEKYKDLMRAWPALWAQLLAVGAALCPGPDAAGAGGGKAPQAIVHNDIKPENLAVEAWDADGSVHLRLIDFDHAWPFDMQVHRHVSYAHAPRAPPGALSSTLYVTDAPPGFTPAYAAPPLQPAFRRLDLPWSVQGVDAWSLANTAYFAFTRALLTPKAVAQMQGISNDTVSQAPQFMVLQEVLDQVQQMGAQYDASLVVEWDPLGALVGAAPPEASAVISLDHIRELLAPHVRHFGDTPRAQKAAHHIVLLFELCSLMALRDPDLRAFKPSPGEDSLEALVEHLRTTTTHAAAAADGGGASVWEALLR